MDSYAAISGNFLLLGLLALEEGTEMLSRNVGEEFYVHVTLHRNKFLYNKTN